MKTSVMLPAILISALLVSILFLLAPLSPAQVPSDEDLMKFVQFMRAPGLVTGGRVEVHWFKDGESFWFESGNKAFQVDTDPVEMKKLRRTPPEGWEAEKPRSQSGRFYSPDFKRYLVSKAGNLSLYEEGSSKETRLAADDAKDVSWQIYPESLSPDGAWLVVARVDVSRVHHLPIIDYTEAEETVDEVVYSKSGGGFMAIELTAFDLMGGEKIVMEAGTFEDVYILPVGWREDSSEYLFLRMTRNAKRLDLMAGDPASEATRIILTETQKTFVGGLDFIVGGWRDLYFPLEGTDEFLWISERDGWRHIYHYHLDGELIQRLTEGEFPVQQIKAADAGQGRVYFTANAEARLYDTHLYSVGLDGEGFRRLTEGEGDHEIQFSPRNTCFMDTHSSLDRPPVSELRSAAGELLLTISEADASRLEAIGWEPPESFVVKADDGKTDLYGVIYKPTDFDPTKSYPVIDFIYAGPFTTVVPNTYAPFSAMACRAQAMAQMGFITFVVDCRGTTERSKAFQDASYGRIGQIEIPDHVATLRQIAKDRPYMDLERVGIYGASWGGYFALRAMLTAPDVFHVGVAGAPGDLTESQPINEPYMDLPQNNPEGYAAGSNPAIAENLEGKLLIVHGTADQNAPFSTTMRMVEALVSAGKLHDLAVLPQADHYFRGPNGPYMAKLAISYFREHLGVR